MKKYLLVMLAVMLGVTFSAFTPIEKAPQGDYMYDDGGIMRPVPPEFDVEDLCPVGDDHDCKIDLGGVEDELIYLNNVVVRWE